MAGGPLITAETVSAGRHLRMKGLSWHTVAKRLGVSYDGIRNHLDPDWKANRNRIKAAWQNRYRVRTGRHAPGGSKPLTLEIYGVSSAGEPDHRPPPYVIAERDARLSRPRTFQVDFLGDPEPGRSALDHRNAGSRHGEAQQGAPWIPGSRKEDREGARHP